MKKKMLFVSSSAANKLNPLINPLKDYYKLDIIYKLDEYIPYYKENKIKRKFFNFLSKIGIPYDYNLNKKIEKYLSENKVDYLLVVKGNELKPYLLKKIKIKYPNIKMINWSLDNMYKKHNRSIYYTNCVPFYDLVVTTKSQNLKKDELPSLGAKNILFVYQSYDKYIHKPVTNCSGISKKHDVLFIGCAEKERYETMNYLAKNGIRINIYGSGWDRNEYQYKHHNLIYHYTNLLNEEYTNAIACSKISLCFLRKVNDDTHTSRSIEIPACRGFMIAERTGEHLELFKENEEAVYFDNQFELLEKVKYYLENNEERINIANNGLLRARNSGYSYNDMVERIVKDIEKL